MKPFTAWAIVGTAICVAVAVAVYVTKNPLCLLALLLMPSIKHEPRLCAKCKASIEEEV